MLYTDVRAKMCAPYVIKSYPGAVGRLYQARCPVCVFVNRVTIVLGLAQRIDTCDHYMRVCFESTRRCFRVRFSRKES